MVAKRSPIRKKKAFQTLGPAPSKKGGVWVAAILGALVLINLYVFVWNKNTSVASIKEKADNATPALTVPSAGGLEPVQTGNPMPGNGKQLVAVPSVGLVSENGSAQVGNGNGNPNLIDAKVGKGDSLGRILKRSGLGPAEADEVIRALSGVLDFKSIRAGQAYRIERGTDGRVRLFELVISKVHKVRAERDDKGTLVAKDDQQQTRIELKEFGGRIDSSLYAAIKSTGEDPSLVAFFVDVFAYDIDFYNDTHEGDEFRVVVEKEFKDQEFLRYRRILAAQYSGRAGNFTVYHFSSDGKAGRYYDESGESVEKSFLKTPLKFARMSSGFDRKRFHPVLHTVKAHLGVDYAAPTGTPVWSASPGVITQRGVAGGAGNMVTVKHDNGLETLYMHLSKFASGQKVGDRIDAKTVVGFVGATGLATGPHLHFGVKKHGEFVDPSRLEPTRGPAVPSAYKAEYLAAAAKLKSRLAALSTDGAAPAGNGVTASSN
ncbi:MAG TPA: peptidoglycan DD-metalloendopeptidase family protein [Kofleriaceae bacterium]|nr:peptidoglycan DD-metalloendopeptidase family protein [Kofleriaceae bacterium]